MKINSEEKKTLIRHLFIKNFMQKLIIMKKKKEERVLNATFIQRRSEIVCKFQRNQNANETRFDVDE
jgi:hypothetical protein